MKAIKNPADILGNESKCYGNNRNCEICKKEILLGEVRYFCELLDCKNIYCEECATEKLEIALQATEYDGKNTLVFCSCGGTIEIEGDIS